MIARTYPNHPLRKLMDERGLSITKLADACELNRSTINNILAGRHSKRSEYTFRSIANALGVTYEEARKICS